MIQIVDEIKNNLKGKKFKICFPEGSDIRILKACEMLLKDKILTPVILGVKDEILKLASQNKINLQGSEIIEVSDKFLKYTEMENLMVELRKGKATKDDVKEMLKKSNYFGTMLVKIGYCDALLGGATYSTADTVRPALQIIKTKPGVKLVSSSFIMIRENKNKIEKLIFSDCALNLFPTSEELVEITKQSVETAKTFKIDPKVALLSYSTLGSGKGDAVDKVRNAYNILKNENVDFSFDGEIQFDAAYMPDVAKIKAPNSNVAGCANVFIFPDINSGNIGYKIAERLGGFEALGPILQGLNAPICDLSRGCSILDIYKMSYITIMQKN